MAVPTAIRALMATLALVVLAACSPGSADRAGPTGTVGTEPPRTTTTHPYAVPAVIDAAYINRVLAGLEGEMGHVTRMIVSTRTIPPEAYERLRAIYGNDRGLQLAIDIFQRDILQGFRGYQRPPGDTVSVVSEVITITGTCVFVRISRDYSAVGINSTPSDTQWIALRPLNPSRDPRGHNLTKWAYEYEGYTETRGQPTNPCAN